MLTRKQKRKLDSIELNFCITMQKAFKVHSDIVDGWGQHLRSAMESVVQKRCKR